MKKISIILLSFSLMCQTIFSMPISSKTVELDSQKSYSGGYYKQDSELVSNRRTVGFIGLMSILVGAALMSSESNLVNTAGLSLIAVGIGMEIYTEFMPTI